MTAGEAPTGDRLGPARARIVAGALALAFILIVAKAASIALAGGDKVASAGEAVQSVRRADIVDRNGDLLATALTAWSLSADPRAIWDAREVAEALGGVLPEVDVEALTTRLSDRDRRFVWVQRGLTPRQKEAVLDLGLEGLRFEEERRRVYPAGRLAGHLLGFVNIDGKGLEGVEYAFEDRLKTGGEPLKLTIDAGVQFALEAELERAAGEFDMLGAAGVVVDARTGAVRAIASWPFIDPNKPTGATETERVNRAMKSVFELGSVYKPLTVAAALEDGKLSLDETFDVSKPLPVGNAFVRDLHPIENAEAATPADILAHSSNVGAAMIGARLGADGERAFLEAVGLTARPAFEGPSASAPLLPAKWTDLTVATVSYGHGIAVTPLAFAMSYVPFANGGDYLPPAILEPVETSRIERRRVMSRETASAMISLLRGVVTRGTGTNADAPGYEVAGKTGTAEKPGPDGYDANRNVTSFAAIFPASRPEFVVLIVLDEAQPKSGDPRTAAYTSAAIAGRFITRAAPLLDVKPVLASLNAPPALPVRAQPEKPAERPDL
ncbi:MAG: penicillin-binding protein 2 [Hyphomonadaceae bacterium]